MSNNSSDDMDAEPAAPALPEPVVTAASSSSSSGGGSNEAKSDGVRDRWVAQMRRSADSWAPRGLLLWKNLGTRKRRTIFTTNIFRDVERVVGRPAPVWRRSAKKATLRTLERTERTVKRLESGASMAAIEYTVAALTLRDKQRQQSVDAKIASAGETATATLADMRDVEHIAPPPGIGKILARLAVGLVASECAVSEAALVHCMGKLQHEQVLGAAAAAGEGESDSTSAGEGKGRQRPPLSEVIVKPAPRRPIVEGDDDNCPTRPPPLPRKRVARPVV
eukprot:m51a1_g14228 hypothetical protein (279) ;mRNA; f:202682-203784